MGPIHTRIVQTISNLAAITAIDVRLELQVFLLQTLDELFMSSNSDCLSGKVAMVTA